MSVVSFKTITPTHWIPPIYSPVKKITVTRADGTIDDITDICIYGKIEDGVTDGIGIFEFTVSNPDGRYTSAWIGMEIVRYYSDYGTTATTLRFRGRVEKSSKDTRNGTPVVTITGRGEALFVQGQTVNKEYTTVDAGYAIKDLFDSYGENRYNTDSITVNTGVLITMSFVDISFWDAVETICQACGYDCYVDCNLVVRFFVSGSIENTTDGFVDDYNLISVGDFAPDLQYVKNKIRVIGGTVDGVQIVYTANDVMSQAKYGIRRETITDDGITTINAAKDTAEFYLASQKDAPIVGEIKGVLLATIQPGESIRLSAQDYGINPGTYTCTKYKHEFDIESDFYETTTVTISKGTKKQSNVIKDIIQRQNKKTGASENPDDLDFCISELFNANVGSHSNTIIENGVLKFSAINGYWTSATYETIDGNNISKLKIGLIGDNLPGIQIYVSINDGLSFIPYSRDELKTGLSGKRFIIKLKADNTTSQVDSIKIQYTTV